VLLCAFLSTSAAAVRGASLFGKVTEVNSGDVITISNLNRPVRVRLLGVDAPEIDQVFGDVAKKHLADLVYDKSVLVEYSGIDGDHSVNGRVLLEGADIGAQMIRDGAAWVDPSNQHRLSATDREVYQQSEVAARSERRGLWQQENPVAPWEFAKAVALRQHPVATLNTVATVRKPVADRPTPELTSLTLMASRLAAAAPAATRTGGGIADLPGFLAPVNGGNWHVLRPAHESFSVLVPEEGETQHLPMPDGAGDLYRARDGRAAFVVIWATGSTYGESDVDAIKMTSATFLQSFGIVFNGRSQDSNQPAASCKSENEKDISMHGFAGLEFEIGSCTVPVKLRVFTRIINGARQMYFAMVLYKEDDNVDRFINSFTITPPKPQKSTKGVK
jgi:endonuclease YncB( thermonuclease family)